MRRAPKTLTLAGLLVALAACGGGNAATEGTGAAGSGGATGTGGGGLTAAEACADSAKASCAKRDMCSSSMHPPPRCTAALAQWCEMRTAAVCVNNLAAKGTASTPAHTEQCSEDYATEACTSFEEGLALCGPALAGSLANGIACGNNAQCSSTFCAVGSTEVCGTCQPLPTTGSVCQVGADCGPGLACAIVVGAAAGVCTGYVPSGGACLTGTTVCEAGASCVGDVPATMTMGTCMLQGSKIGDACDGSRKTLAVCSDLLGLACIPPTKGTTVGTCQNVTYVTAGMPCGPVGSAPITGVGECTAGALCVKAMGSATGTCVAAAADGAACDSDVTKGPPCLSPARCVPSSAMSTAGTCKLLDATQCM